MLRYYNLNTTLPKQKVSTREKGKRWKKDSLNAIISMATSTGKEYEKDRVNYDLFAGVLDPDDFAHITEPYGQDTQTPVDFQHFDIVSSKFNLLLGEEIKRPFNFKVRATNEDSIRVKENKLHQALVDNIKNKIVQDLIAEGLIEQPENAEEPIPLEEIDKYYTYTYKEAHEAVAEDLLNYFVKDLDMQRKFNEGFLDGLITAKEIYWTGIQNGNPRCKVINPIYFDWDKSANVEYIEDSQWAVYSEWLQAGEIIDLYGDELTEDDLNWLDTGIKGGKQGPFGANSEINVSYNREGPWFAGSSGTADQRGQNGIHISHAEWKSMKRIGFLKYLDSEGMLQETIVDDSFKWKNFDGDVVNLEWKWVTEVWEGTKIGDDIYVGIRPKPNQYRSVDNPYDAKLSYTGIVYDDRNTIPTSLMDRMKPFQYEFNIMMYRISNEMSKAQGRKVMMDLAQLPTGGEYNWTMEEWLYYTQVLGIMFIDSHAENNKGEKSGFNQFKDVDMSVSSSVNQMFDYLNQIDYRCARVSGISEQREGQIGKTELATNAERSVQQSSHITEVYFYKHNELKKRVLQRLLEVAKMAYRDGKKIQYITDDFGTRVINIEDDFLYADHGLFVSNSAKDEQALDYAKQLAQAGMSSGALRMSDVLELLTSESIVRIKNKIKQSENAQDQREQQAQQQQMEIEQQQLEQQARSEQVKIELDYAKIEAELEMNRLDNETRLEQEILKASLSSDEGRQAELDIKREEIAKKFEIEIKKLNTEKELKLKDIESKIKIASMRPKTAPAAPKR